MAPQRIHTCDESFQPQGICVALAGPDRGLRPRGLSRKLLGTYSVVLWTYGTGSMCYKSAILRLNFLILFRISVQGLSSVPWPIVLQ